MARILITLNPVDIGTLLLGGTVEIEPTVKKIDNLTGITISGDAFTNMEEDGDA